ncbi:hypothetical protein K0504_10150 [Neiella marina]|uniref:Uncharacterized protein n=1 Tax=Neiella holothuriorum TaxID=2870530 RepID=A0ABS7EGJ8_9GAMM|nr:hypothetical protein [Neiella holothuriorum]MBW8191400.1 hypothetical protein [Neiella holothuriorum]
MLDKLHNNELLALSALSYLVHHEAPNALFDWDTACGLGKLELHVSEEGDVFLEQQERSSTPFRLTFDLQAAFEGTQQDSLDSQSAQSLISLGMFSQLIPQLWAQSDPLGLHKNGYGERDALLQNLRKGSLELRSDDLYQFLAMPVLSENAHVH